MMKRNLKALGLALVAAFAMSAVVASAAQAEKQAFFTADGYPAVLTGTQEGGAAANYFEATPNNKVHCANVSYEGTLTEASTSITITPHYTTCTATRGAESFAANVDLNGCHYTFTAGTKVAHGSSGSAHVVCPAGQQIEVTIAGGLCRVDVGPQTVGGGAGEITFTNKASDVHVDVNVQNQIDATDTDPGGIFCPFTHTTVTEGDFLATVTIDGYKDLGTHAGTTEDPDGGITSKPTATEGAATAISIS